MVLYNQKLVVYQNKCYRMVLLLPTGKNSQHSQVAVCQRQAHCHLWPCREFFLSTSSQEKHFELNLVYICLKCVGNLESFT